MGVGDAPTFKLCEGHPDLSMIGLKWRNEDIYDYIEVWRKENGGSYSKVKTTGPDDTYWNDSGRSFNVTYGYKLRAWSWTTGAYTPFSNEKSCTLWLDAGADIVYLSGSTSDQHEIGDFGADTICLSEATSDGASISDSASDTIRIVDDISDIYTLTLETNYGYYFGGFDGKVYHENEGYTSDDGEPINVEWYGKVTDFAEFDDEALGHFKTVYKARLYYVDLTASTQVTVSLSTDGGNTWTPRSRALGTGDGAQKTEDFFFILTGDTFQPRVTCDDVAGKLQWTALELYYSIGGDYFSVG